MISGWPLSWTDIQVDANQELIAQGSSNIFGSFFSCIVMAGSLSRSVVQEASGCRQAFFKSKQKLSELSFFYVSKLSNQDFVLFFQCRFLINPEYGRHINIETINKEIFDALCSFEDINFDNPLTSKTFQNGSLG